MLPMHEGVGELPELRRVRVDRRLGSIVPTGRLVHDAKRLARPTNGEPPVRFVDGVLWMRAGLRVTRIEAWPSLRAWSRPRPGATEREHRPRIDFLSLHRLALGPERPDESSLWAWVRLVASIPLAVRDRVAAYRSGHWRLLQLVGHVPPALDLFDNPALAFLVAHASRFRPRSAIDLSILVAGRRRAILGALGFPAVEAMVRLLGRLPPAAIDLSRLLGLREALREDPEWLRWLPHLVRAGTSAIDMVSDRRLRPALTRELVQAIAGIADPAAAAVYVRLARDTVEMAARPEARQVEEPPAPRVRGLGALRRAHDRLAARVTRVERMRGSAPLPDPPVAGTEAIQPLTSTGDLLDEGEQQHNCVGSYALCVRSGTFYVYRMLQPERATLSIVCIGGSWLIDDLRTKRNRAASDGAWQAARDWLAGTAFPEPPLRGTAVIEALVSPTMLRAEWHARALPVGLADDAVAGVLDGDAYFYRLTKPERATIRLQRVGPRWFVEWIWARSGSAVRDSTRRAVALWLACECERPVRSHSPSDWLPPLDAQEGGAPAGEIPDPPAIVSQVPPPPDVPSPSRRVATERVHRRDQAIVEPTAPGVRLAPILGRRQPPSGPCMRVSHRGGEDVVRQACELRVLTTSNDSGVDRSRFLDSEHHEGDPTSGPM